MTADANKARLYEVIERFNAGDLDGYLTLYAPDVTLHGHPPGLPPGTTGLRTFYEGMLTAFQNGRLTLDDVIAEGDRVGARYTLTASHDGGFLGVPRTGRTVTLTGITMLRFADGACVERWQQADMLGLLQQIGAVPA